MNFLCITYSNTVQINKLTTSNNLLFSSIFVYSFFLSFLFSYFQFCRSCLEMNLKKCLNTCPICNDKPQDSSGTYTLYVHHDVYILYSDFIVQYISLIENKLFRFLEFFFRRQNMKNYNCFSCFWKYCPALHCTELHCHLLYMLMYVLDANRFPYVRSEHLDSAVWLLMEACSSSERDVSTPERTA